MKGRCDGNVRCLAYVIPTDERERDSESMTFEGVNTSEGMSAWDGEREEVSNE